MEFYKSSRFWITAIILVAVAVLAGLKVVSGEAVLGLIGGLLVRVSGGAVPDAKDGAVKNGG